MPDTFVLSVPGKAEYVSTVRLAVSSLAARQGFDIEAIDDIKVAVSEACSNILIHSRMDEDHPYRVECVLTGGAGAGLEITVADDGVGFDAQTYEKTQKASTPDPDLDDLHAGGLGIYIIKALMDDVQVVSHEGKGTLIRMTKQVQPMAGPGAAAE